MPGVTQIGVAEAIDDSSLGKKVDRATSDVLTGSAVSIFTISGGRVLLLGLIGEVTTVIGTGTTPEAKFQLNPTAGTTVDLCAALDLADDEVGTLYSITGTPGDAMLAGSSGAVRNMAAQGVVLDAGAIEFICDENVSGSISFQARYLPLDAGARLVAA